MDKALARLDGALAQLEAAARRRIEAERGRANLETELALMQDDRARLAASSTAPRRVSAMSRPRPPMSTSGCSAR